MKRKLIPLQIVATQAPSPDYPAQLFALCEDAEGRRSIWYRAYPSKLNEWQKLPAIMEDTDRVS